MSTDEQIINHEMMDDSGCSANEPFALRVLGDSMEPEFPDGCIVIIDPITEVENSAYVLAETRNEGYIFRQFVVEGERTFLAPINKGYPSIEVTGESVIRGLIVQRSGASRKQHKRYI